MRVFIDTNLWGEYLYMQYPWVETTVDDLLEKDLVVSDILLVELWPVMPTGLGKIYEVLDNIRRQNVILEYMLPEDIRGGLDIHEKYRAQQTKNLGIADLFHAAIAIRSGVDEFHTPDKGFLLLAYAETPTRFVVHDLKTGQIIT